ncbi:BCS1 N terminal-domain-containing protein [Tuber brumale]|nr:BCS1 N terminal-domain-containing protein [Tuber brumale]
MATLSPPATANSSLPTQFSPLSILEAFMPSYLSPLVSYLGLSNAFTHILAFFLITSFMSTVQIRSRDELYDHMMAWVAEQEFSARTRYFVATMAFGSLFAEGAGRAEEEEEESEEPDAPSWERNRRAPLQFTPAPGLHYFKYKGSFVMLERIVEDNDKTWFPQEILEFSIMGRKPQLLKDMLKEARSRYLTKDKSKTVVHRPKAPEAAGSPPTWVRCLARPSRPLSTVVLEQNQKKMFVDDIKDYLEPGTQKWYSDRGIPYRRGYLLHGPPGTGKSSLSFAAAGLLGLKIYVLSLASKALSDAGLASLFDALPPRCVVLLEDIDTISIAQSRKPADTTDETPKKTTTDTSTDASTKVSLSGLLNVIDGVASPEGRVLILTTNHPEKLDAALIRPGRVDMKIEFKLAGEEAIAGLFMRMYEDYNRPIAHEKEEPLVEGSGAPTPPYTPTSPADPALMAEKERIRLKEKEAKRAAEERAAKEKHLSELVAKFTQTMPQEMFSPAEIQGYLLQHKNQPERAVECAEKWVCDRIEARKGGKID